MRDHPGPELAIIVPVLNEAENLNSIVHGITRSLKTSDFEIVFVDDDSSDGSD